MSLRQRPARSRGPANGSAYAHNRGEELFTPQPPSDSSEETFNIIPVHNPLADHPSLRYPEVQAAAAALRAIGDIHKSPFVAWQDGMDILDWLGAFFGFQRDNVRNQREHLVLHLANAQMRLQPPPQDTDSLDFTVLRRFRRKLLKNYSAWCSYLGCKSNVCFSDDRDPAASDHRLELLYTSLYLLIWGEAANLRFVPECICYIFHHMAMELNAILEERPVLTSISGEKLFLNDVVTPIYQIIREEVERSGNGTVPHSAWRNYDDFNEYFWSPRCFQQLKWPIDSGSNFFVTTGKTGFVEQRSFWNIFRSFNRLWIMLILFLQAAIIIAWEGQELPWQSRDVQARLLTVFITWGGLLVLQSLLDAVTQYSLVSRETLWLGVRMLLKTIVATTWTVVFGVLHGRIRYQRNHDGEWSGEANRRVVNFIVAAFLFILPKLLALPLFILPCIWNFLEETNWRIFHELLPWWFQSRTFLGRGLGEGIVDCIKYSLFWVAILTSKFTFSYFLQIKPMIATTKAVLNVNDIRHNWLELLNEKNSLAVGLLWILVVMIYLMDLQIWYSIFCAMVGVMVGFFSHLGEIRNIHHLRLRFQFFASAMQFNLIPPEEQTLNSKETLRRSKFKEAIHRLKLWYGLGRTYKKMESNQVEGNKFAVLWNEIITAFREEDIISDCEVELLELASNCWNIRVIRWPIFLLCNELLFALRQATEMVDAPDNLVWRKICKHEYRRCAVIEAYDSIKHLLLEIVKDGTEEHSFVTNLFQKIDLTLQMEKFTTTFNLTTLPQIHSKLISLVKLVNNKPEKDVNKVINVLQALYEEYVIDFLKVKRTTEQLKQDGLVPLISSSARARLLFENAVELPDVENGSFYRQVQRLHAILTCKDSMQNIPKNQEARRRIAFFSNSMFMNMPHAPQVEKMMAFSVLTPYCNEEVMYSKEQLWTKNEDGITALFYLQKIYDDEWNNFLERLRREGMVDDQNEIWTTKLRDLRLWASCRGQTLSRTVRGMMYYYKALKMQAFLDTASDMDIREEVSPELASVVGSMMRDSSVDGLGSGHEYATALLKYTYVVACQFYGAQKAQEDPHAEDILYLMKTNEALRVAYVDEVPTGRDKVEYYSVLVKYDRQLEKEVEIYRIRLPGPWKLGEGKLENQNHAIIFTRGDAVQTIDMNQDNYFEEALKMRNLLEEFNTYYGIRKPTILGVREHIFTAGSVSSLAWFMSAQETSFVTSGQRVLANPLKVRMHYGHSDVFDRFWFLTRGGISKASRVINISEDIFAGFNCTLRGGNVTHHEYIQVGKGRDAGLNQISMFEAKLASGNGEQVLSRDVYRLGHRLDFFRMLSFFYSSVGFYFNTMMVVLTIYAFLWGRLYLSPSGSENSMVDNSNNYPLGTNPNPNPSGIDMNPSGTDNTKVDSSIYNKLPGMFLNQQVIILMGLFTPLLMIVETCLEHGLLHAVWNFLTMQLHLSSIFHTFSMGTRTHFFGRTILHGGAKYRPTGHGFVMQHNSFAEIYRFYSRSHFVKAIELGMILTVHALQSSMAKDSFLYLAMTISSWFLVASWIIAPFVFNPFGFDWSKTVHDFDGFMKWIWHPRGVFTQADESWETWWYEEQDHLRMTSSLFGKSLEIILDLRYFFFQYRIVYQLGISDGHTSNTVYLLSWIIMVVVISIYVILAYAQHRYDAKGHIYFRLVQFLVIVLVVLVIVVVPKFTHIRFVDILTNCLELLPKGWGLLSIAQVFRPFLQSTVLWDTVVSLARLYDILFGVIVMVPVALISWMPGYQAMQTRILFSEAFNRRFQMSRLLAELKDQMLTNDWS